MWFTDTCVVQSADHLECLSASSGSLFTNIAVTHYAHAQPQHPLAVCIQTALPHTVTRTC